MKIVHVLGHAITRKDEQPLVIELRDRHTRIVCVRVRIADDAKQIVINKRLDANGSQASFQRRNI